MYGLRSSGVSPAPSTGAGSRWANGWAFQIISPMKKEPSAARMAVAQGTISRWRRRVMKRTPLEASESTQPQSSSEPSWLDHIAVSL